MIKLEPEKLEASVGTIVKVCNSDALDKMQSLANAVLSEAGSNNLVDQAIEDCKKFQTQFNETKESLTDLIREMGTAVELDEYIKKLDVGTVKGRDTSFAAKKIDKDAVMH